MRGTEFIGVSLEMLIAQIIRDCARSDIPLLGCSVEQTA